MSFFRFNLGQLAFKLSIEIGLDIKIIPELKLIGTHKCRNGGVLSFTEILKISVEAGTRRKKRFKANDTENSQRGFGWDGKNCTLKLHMWKYSHFIDL